jgi:hypothetical protein
MDRLTSFGLFAVTSMLITYALEERSTCSSWPLLDLACSALPMGFYRVRGPSD